MTSTQQEATVPLGYEDVPHREIRLKARRRAIARNLEVSSRIPSLTADMQIDLSQLLDVRAQANGAVAGDDRLSVMAFVARATASVLIEFPQFNATYTERAMLEWESVNLGVAVDAPGGLVVPVIREVQALGVREINAEARRLAERARTGQLVVEELAGGTFTLSNPGSVGPSVRAEALLNPPQVALLGLPGLKRAPVVVGKSPNESISIRTVLCPSLTFDHRGLDGGDAVRFLSALTQRVEDWELKNYLQPEVPR